MRLVCVDTQVLIWGVRKTAGSAQQDMVPRTEQLLDFLDSQKTSIPLEIPPRAKPPEPRSD